jgi:hypothetical protein
MRKVWNNVNPRKLNKNHKRDSKLVLNYVRSSGTHPLHKMQPHCIVSFILTPHLWRWFVHYRKCVHIWSCICLSLTLVTDTASTASVVWWSEFLATDPEVRVRFPVLPDLLRSSGSGTGSLSLVSTIEELLERNSSSSSLESQEYGHRGSIRLAMWQPLFAKLALTSPTNSGHSVGLDHLRTQTTEFFYFLSIIVPNSLLSSPLIIQLSSSWLQHSRVLTVQ